MEKLIAHRIVEDDAAPLPAAVVPAWRLKRRRRVKEVAESLVDQLLEARPTRVFDLISQMLKGTPGIEVVDTWTQADGMASLFKTEDGQAYEVQLRPAAYAKHPSIAQHYGTGVGRLFPSNGVSSAITVSTVLLRTMLCAVRGSRGPSFTGVTMGGGSAWTWRELLFGR